MMPAVLLSMVPFPAADWWLYALCSATLRLDGKEHFQKMSRRNRYRIGAANGPALLSVPLAGSRDQRNIMEAVRIDNSRAWQVQHWRTLTSAYRRAPFFGHFEPELALFFTRPYERLCDFNTDSIRWLQKQLGMPASLATTDVFEKTPTIADARDEQLRWQAEDIGSFLPRYHQVFEDRHGFVPGLSVLDLLFSEGPAAGLLLRQAAKKWGTARGLLQATS